MLQQTQVATVIDYYRRFMKRFPTVKQLAAADQADVLKLWEGLGYYRRARQLHAAAQVIVDRHGGQFPTKLDDVIALPGIGRYTAGAILSISQDQRLPILEGNTIRLFSRLTLLRTDPRTSQNQKLLWEFAESLLPKQRAGDFNQSLMELGSEICTPRRPACDQCPLMRLCPTFIQSLQNEIPASSRKQNYEDLHEAVIVVRRSGKYLLRICGPGERWEGLWDFPRYQIDPDRNEPENRISLTKKLEADFGLSTKLRATGPPLKHAVTKYRITLDCYLADSVKGRMRSNQRNAAWKTAEEIDQLALSTTGRKIARRLGSNHQLLLDS